MVDIEYNWGSGDNRQLTSDRYLVMEGGDLKIVNVGLQDSGVYFCKVSYGGVDSGMVETEAFKYMLTGEGL